MPAQPIAHEEYPLCLAKSRVASFCIKNNNPDAWFASGSLYCSYFYFFIPSYSSSGQSAMASSSAESANDTVGAL